MSVQDLSPAEQSKLEKEVEEHAAQKEAFWKPRADAKDWDAVRADLMRTDPRRTEAYRELVWAGLKIESGPTWAHC